MLGKGDLWVPEEGGFGAQWCFTTTFKTRKPPSSDAHSPPCPAYVEQLPAPAPPPGLRSRLAPRPYLLPALQACITTSLCNGLAIRQYFVPCW